MDNKKKKIIFYSWQSDLPNSSNRGLIEDSLKKAVKKISKDDELKIEPVIDRDISGESGSVDISATIFRKISKSSIYICDVSIINNEYNGRKTPNPNVLIELGYAIKVLNYSNVILVMNEEFGDVNSLPFDLKTKYVITYNTKKQKDMLVSKLESQLKTIFSNQESTKEEDGEFMKAIQEQKPSRIKGIRNYMKDMFAQIENFYPGDGMVDSRNADEQYDEKIVEALGKTKKLVLDFRKIIEEITMYEDYDLLKEVLSGFIPILENYDRKTKDPGGTTHKAKYDYYRFLGNELLVIIVSILLREEKWDMLKVVLEKQTVIDNVDGRKKGSVDFKYFEQNTPCFVFRKQRLKSERAESRFDLLSERRKDEEKLYPNVFKEYTSADLLLFLKAESKKVNSTDVMWEWTPYSLQNFELPDFILKSIDKKYAEHLIESMKLKSIQDMQILLKNKVSALSKLYNSPFWNNPIEDEDIDYIGTM